MPTERMEEVEVVCHLCAVRSGYGHAGKASVLKGSLTAARLRLADAAEAWMEVPAGAEDHEWIAAKREVTTALAALRTARGEG